MNYTEMLNKIISESGMTNIEIIRRCEEVGEKITPNYLSILKNTEGRIPSENVSNTIAKVCNASRPDILTIQAYIDKAPKKILVFIEKVYEGAMNVTLQFLEAQKETLTKEEFIKIKENATKEFEKISLADFICDYMDENMEINLPQLPLNIKTEGEYIVIPKECAKYATSAQIEKLKLE